MYIFQPGGLQHLLRERADFLTSADLLTMQTLGVFFQSLAYQTEARGCKLTKALFIICAWFCKNGDWIIKAEYGNIARAMPLTGGVLASGYHVAQCKPM